jgi:hypothetical protein
MIGGRFSIVYECVPITNQRHLQKYAIPHVRVEKKKKIPALISQGSNVILQLNKQNYKTNQTVLRSNFGSNYKNQIYNMLIFQA